MAYQFIQLTDNTVGAVATDALLPLGNVTRRYSNNCGCNETFIVSTSGSDTVTITESGFYKVSYTGSLVAGAAGLVTLNLTSNGIVVATASETATAAGTVNISLEYIIRVLPNCCASINNPVILQIVNAGVALTGGTSNLIIEKVR